MADTVAPLGFSIDTDALLKAAEAADKTAGSLKAIGTGGGEAQKGMDGIGKSAGDSAKSLNDQAEAAKKAAEANEAHAKSIDKVKDAQAALAAAPKPTEQSSPWAPGANNTPAPPKPVMSKSGGYYANQEMADWADAQDARQKAARASQDARVAAVKGSDAGNLKDIAEAASEVETGTGAAARGMGLATVAASALGAAIGGAALSAVVALGKASLSAADDAELLDRRLTAITGSSERAAAAIEGASRAARLSGTLGDAQGGLRTGLERSAMNVGGSERDQFGATIAQIDQLGGGKASDFAALGNAITGAFKDGRVELKELNDLLDRSPELANKLADGLGMPIEQIKLMAAQGDLFADDFVRGINKVSGETQTAFNGMQRTGESAFTNLKRASGDFFESLGQATGISGLTANIGDAITKGFDDAKTIIQNDGFWKYQLRLWTNPMSQDERAADINQGQRQAAESDARTASFEGRATGAAGRPFVGDFRQTGHVGEQRATGAHGGADFAMRAGTPIYAPIGGTYRYKDASDGDGGGNRVRIVNGATVDDLMHLSGSNGASRAGNNTVQPRDINATLPGIQVNAGDLIGYSGNSGRSTGDHLHWQRKVNGRTVDPVTGQAGDAAITARGQELLTTGASTQIANLENDLEAAKRTGNTTLVAEIENRLRSARAQQARLGDTSYSRASESAADRERAGGNPILQQAYSAYRASSQQGYGDSEQSFVDLGIRGAVTTAGTATDRLRQQAEAERQRGGAVTGGRAAQDQAQIEAQTAEFRRQNFGSLEDGRITAAVNDYRKALEALKTAQRDTANAQELLNAQNKAGVELAGAAALGAGQRGFAVDLARQRAEEAVIARNGGSVEASRLGFNTRNIAASAAAGAQANDNAQSDGRYMGIGSDAYSRRQFGRDEQTRQAGQGFNGVLRMGEAVAGQQREDERLAKDRADADTESVKAAERQLQLVGLYGAERRAAAAVLERENQLINQGLLPADGHLTASERERVELGSERLRQLDEQAQRSQELAEIGGNTAKAVGDGLRGTFSDLFADGKIKAEAFAKTVGNVVSRIGTNIADVLVVRPLEKATEKLADQAASALGNFVGRRGGGGGAGSVAGATGDAKAAIASSARASADTKGAIAATARASADAKVTLTATAATSALSMLAKAALAAAAAQGGETTKKVVSAVASAAAAGAGGTPTPHALGGAFGGVGASPTVFPMAGGMGLAFEAGPEAVLPLKRGADGRLGVASSEGGGGPSIIINDMRSAGSPDVETEQSKGQNGNDVIRMTIRGEVKSAIREGEMDGPMRDTYGVARQVRRA